MHENTTPGYQFVGDLTCQISGFGTIQEWFDAAFIQHTYMQELEEYIVIKCEDLRKLNRGDCTRSSYTHDQLGPTNH